MRRNLCLLVSNAQVDMDYDVRCGLVWAESPTTTGAQLVDCYYASAFVCERELRLLLGLHLGYALHAAKWVG